MTALPERTPPSNDQMPSINIGRFRIDRVEEFLLPGFAPDALYPAFDPSVFKEWSGLRAFSVRSGFEELDVFAA